MREMLRAAIRLHVLHHSAGGEINGAWMADELARHGYKISPGTLYPALHHMEAAGLIESRKEVRNGRTIRLYRATDLGRQTLEEEREMLFEFVKELLGRDPRPSPEQAAAHSDA